MSTENISNLLRDTSAKTLSRILIIDEDLDNQKIVDKSLTLSRINRVGFKCTEFRDCNFNHSSFEDCYFRKAKFYRVSFVGCTFRDCHFEKAEFTDCNFGFAEFFNCYITFEQFLNTLPQQDGILFPLARNLRVNSENRGLNDDARRFLMLELKATERHNYKKAFDWTDPFYKTKYRWTDRIKGFWTWISLKFNWLLWGHGEAPHKVFLSAAIVIAIFALIYYIWFPGHFSGLSEASFIEMIGISIGAFTTAGYGGIVPETMAARWTVTLQSAIGLTLFGFFVTALYRRVSKR